MCIPIDQPGSQASACCDRCITLPCLWVMPVTTISKTTHTTEKTYAYHAAMPPSICLGQIHVHCDDRGNRFYVSYSTINFVKIKFALKQRRYKPYTHLTFNQY